LPNMMSTTQKEVNNKISIACFELYGKSFLKSDSNESLAQYRHISQKSFGKVLADVIWSYA
jgi:hypothetical protein